ncbi:MAG: hypothetical protein Q7T55_23395 [Solirubrobacteraceae bacterium]|nr:hypothetical protein [Solirubrobacteraceae bacterium]
MNHPHIEAAATQTPPPIARVQSARRCAATSLARAILGASLLALTACGGGESDSGSEAANASSATNQAATPVVVPLFDDDGGPAATALAATPSDPALRTRSGLYATPEQYRWEALLNSAYTMQIDLDAAESMQAAILGALAARDWQAPGNAKIGWFVKAADPHAGARLADALHGLGLDNVFLIVGAAPASR